MHAMKSAVVAWVLFCLGMLVPTTLLGGITLQAGLERELATVESQWNRRVTTAAALRDRLEQGQKASLEALRSLPETATPAEMEESLREAAPSEPFAVPFYAVDETVTVIGAASAEEKASLETALAHNLIVQQLRGHDSSYSKDHVSAIASEENQLLVRRLENGCRVGFVKNTTTVLRGAETSGELTAPERFGAEPSPAIAVRLEVVPESQRDRYARSRPALKKGTFIVSTFGSLPVSMLQERDDLASFTLGEFMRFRVANRDQDKLAAFVRAQRQQVWAVGLGCITMLIAVAAAFFKRARAAKRLADLRTDFVAAVSHELRTPLASVRMFAELLEAGDVSEDERAEVEQALAGETRRLHATLDRMLRYGALARGKLVLAKQMQLLAPIAKEAAQKREVTLDVPGDLEANVDGGMLGLALDNLLSNAAKYAPDGGPYVLRARLEGDEVWIDVTDRGPGLSKSAQKKVFQPFERADNRLSKATEGSGVGLALVRGIARAHGGDATVASEIGQGATFTLRLPRS